MLLAGLGGVGPTSAQDLEPGTYTNAPVGANVLLLALGRMAGDEVDGDTVLFQPLEHPQMGQSPRAATTERQTDPRESRADEPLDQNGADERCYETASPTGQDTPVPPMPQ